MGVSQDQPYLSYSTATGYFLQDDPTSDSETFDYAKTGFGLIDQPYDTDLEFDPERKKTQWERFEYKIQELNRKAPADTEFKLLYLGRHGQGYHNVAEAFYGTEAWECHWAQLDGDGRWHWADPILTELGIAQAKLARDTWREQINLGIPLPETYYTSPLHRCLDTATITFGDLPLPQSQPFIPTIKELLRETIGIHTCDRRSSRKLIEAWYPNFLFEPTFVNNDPYWDANLRESNSMRNIRLRRLLDDIFTHDKSTSISLTAHGGAIESILENVRHLPFKPPTGGVIPVLVRAEKKTGVRPPDRIDPPKKRKSCPDEGRDPIRPF